MSTGTTRAESAPVTHPNALAYETISRGGFCKMPRCLLGLGLTINERVVLCVLLSYVRPSWGFTCYPSQDSLRFETEMSDRTLRRSLDSLSEKGFLERSRPSRRQSNRYYIRLTVFSPNGSESGQSDQSESGQSDRRTEEGITERNPSGTTYPTGSHIPSALRSTARGSKMSKSRKRPQVSDFNLKTADIDPVLSGEDSDEDLVGLVMGTRVGFSEARRSELVEQLTQNESLQRQWFRDGHGLLKRVRKAHDTNIDEWTGEQLWTYWRLLVRLRWPDTEATLPKATKFQEIALVGKTVGRFGHAIAKRLLESMVVRWEEIQRNNRWIDLDRPSVAFASGEKMGPTLVKQLKLDRSESVAKKLSGGIDPMEQLRRLKEGGGK